MAVDYKECIDCKTRYAGCHSECPKYLAAKREEQRKKQWLKKQNSTEGLAFNSSFRACKSFMKPWR